MGQKSYHRCVVSSDTKSWTQSSLWLSPVVANMPASAGKIPHASWQLSQGDTTTEPVCCKLLKPVCLELMIRSKRNHHDEKSTHSN